MVLLAVENLAVKEVEPVRLVVNSVKNPFHVQLVFALVFRDFPSADQVDFGLDFAFHRVVALDSFVEQVQTYLEKFLILDLGSCEAFLVFPR